MSGTWGGYPWGGAPWGGPVETSSDGATLFEACRSYLKSRAELSALTEIYKNKPKRNFTYPYLIMSSINGESELTNSPDYTEEEEYQFSVMSDDDLQAEDIGRLVRRALLPHTNRKLVFGDGYDMTRGPTYHGRVIEQPGRGPTNSNVWMYVFGFKFLVGRTEQA